MAVDENPVEIRFAPLPPETANPAFQRIQRKRPTATAPNPAAFVPLFYAALLYLAGIVLAHYRYLRPTLLLVGLLPLAVVAVLAIYKAHRLTWLPLAAIWLVLGIWSAETELQPAPDSAVAQLSDGILRTVEGTVVDAGPIRGPNSQTAESQDSDTDTLEESQSAEKAQRQRIDLELTAAEVVSDTADTLVPLTPTSSNRLRISILWPGSRSAQQPINCGQRLRAVVRILPPDTFHDPGVWSRPDWLESQQISAIANLNANKLDGSIPRLEILNTPATSFHCQLNRWRNAASARLETLPTITQTLPKPLRASPEDAAMLTALLTGDRTYLTRSLRVGFERTGSFHLIVVSGLHLAILAGCVFALARRLRLTRTPATLLTLAVALAYALFTGFAVPIQRSFWMVALYLIGRLLYRTRSPLNAIGLATLCLAAASPRSIFDASLQMTVLSVASIAGIAIPLLERTLHARIQATRDLRIISIDPKLPPRIAQFRVTLRLIARHLEPATNARIAWKLFPLSIRLMLRLGELLFVTLVVELALALPMAIYFHRITVYALPVNLCILPLLAILLPAAMLLLLALAIWPAAAILPATITLALLHFSVFVVRKLGALAFGDLRVPAPAPLAIAAALVCFVLALQLARSAAKPRRIAFAALIAVAAVALAPRPVAHPADALLFEAIDVGQGDSLLLIAPDGKTILIDAGGVGLSFLSNRQRPTTSEFDIGEEVVSAALWARGIRRLDAVALTHAHHDHMGGLPAVLRNFRPRELWVGNNPAVPAYTALLAQARAQGTAIRSLHAGETVTLGTIDFRILAPDPSYRPGPQPTNNDSLVMQAHYRASTILLEGDAEAPEENTILHSAVLQSTLLKVGHHGSLTSTRPPFLAQVAPAWAVISCGRRNRFGHPREEILAELHSAHTRTLRTDLDGAVCFLLNGQAGPQAVTVQPLCPSDPQ